MNSDPIDLSPLEPDAERWRAGVRHTLGRVDAVLQRRASETAISMIVRWRRTVLAAAAVVVAVVAPLEWLMERRERSQEPVHALVRLADRTLQGEVGPSGAQLRGLVQAGGR